MNDAPEKSEWQVSEEAKGEEAARQLSNFLNILGSENHRLTGFVAAMGCEHRTLQQAFTRLCVEWLRECARKLEAKDFDLRNEASCRLGERFVLAVGDRAYLPLV